MLRPPIRFAALTIATDAAGVAFTSGDVQTVLAVLGAVATIAFALIAFGRKDGTSEATMKNIEKSLTDHFDDDTRRFESLEKKVDATHQSVHDALQTMIEIGTGRRQLSRDLRDTRD